MTNIGLASAFDVFHKPNYDQILLHLTKMCVLIRPEYYKVSQEKTILSIGIAEKYVETFIDTFYFDIGFEVY